MTTINTPAQFRNELDKTIKSIGKIQGQVHALAMYALTIALKHGTMNNVQTLLDELPNGLNTPALGQWFVEFGNIVIKEGKVTCGQKSRMHEPEKYLAMADATPYWNFKRVQDEKEIKPTNYQSLLVSLLAKAKREAAEGKTVIGLELIEAVEATLPDSVKELVETRAAKKAA
jgi:hypothetical protein